MPSPKIGIRSRFSDGYLAILSANVTHCRRALAAKSSLVRAAPPEDIDGGRPHC